MLRFKYTKSIVETSFTIMFLGLALLSFHPEQQNLPASSLGENPSVSGTPADASPSPQATSIPTNTPTPSPTPTPSLAELNAVIPIEEAADTQLGTDITALMTTYLTAYYSGDYETLKTLVPEDDLPSTEQLASIVEDVNQISNITCYYKAGLSYADYIVYVCYDIQYAGSTVFIPAIEEFCISYHTETAAPTVYPSILNDEVADALFLSRASETVQKLYIRQTILRYINAKLACDETILHSLVTNPALIDIDDISTKTQYIEQYTNPSFLLRPCPEEIKDIRYIVYVSYDVKIVNIATLAPGADEFMISIDTENYPKIFFGTTSDETDAYLVESRKMDDFIALYNDVNDRLTDAILSDSTLREFMQRIYDATQ